MAAPAPAVPIEQGAASSEAADEAPDRVVESTETVLRVHDIFCEVPGKVTVERALRSCSGVTDVSVDLETKLARVQGSAPADALVAALEAAGKTAELVPQTVLRVESMMCGHCTASVDRALRAVADVVDCQVDLESKLASVCGTAPAAKLLEACAGISMEAVLVSSQVPLPPAAPVAKTMTVLRVEGMMCGHCTASVEGALRAVPDVANVTVDLDSKLARVEGSAPSEALVAAVVSAGKTAVALPAIVLRVDDMMCGHCTSTVDKALRDVFGVADCTVDLETKLATVYGKVTPRDLMEACSAAHHQAELVAWTAPKEPSSPSPSKASSGVFMHADVTQADLDRLRVVVDKGGSMEAQKASSPPLMRPGGNGLMRSELVRAMTSSPTSSPVTRRVTDLSNQVSRVLLGTKEESVLLAIKGMTCAACVGAVERALVAVPGVREVSVSLMGKRGQVFFTPDSVETAALVDAVNAIGFEAKELNGDADVDPTSNFSSEAAYYRGQFFGSLPLAIAAMLVSKMLPAAGPEPVKEFLAYDVIPGLSIEMILVILFVTPVQFIFGLPFYRKAFSALRHGSANMDVLVVLGTTVAYLYSLYFTVYSIRTAGAVGRENLCFETSAMLINFMLLGRYLETSAKRRASEAVSQLLTLQPPSALRVIGGQSAMGKSELLEDVAAAKLVPQDVVKVLPGSTVPADGVVVQGASAVNESMLTGEAVPVRKEVQDNVVGGSVNGSGVLWVIVGAVGSDSVLAKIMKLVSDAQMRKPAVQAYADRIAQFFVPTVVVISLVTWTTWVTALVLGCVPESLVEASGLADGETMAFMFGAATLVIACPCALGLATPTAVMVGSGVGAQLGILFKGGDVLEDASKVTAVVFDKTGTLTKGALEVGLIAVWAEGMSHHEVLELAASAERHSEHPIGQAILAASKMRHLTLGAITHFSTTPGLGLSCAVDDRPVLLGNRAWLLKHGYSLNEKQEADAARRERQGETVVLLVVGEVVAGMIALSDVLQSNSMAVVMRMAQMGIEVWMATGDNQRTASHVARELGIKNVIADAKPQNKREHVSELQKQGHIVAMVGDGVNDAPAIAQADVGIAVGSGTDVAIETADVVLMKSALRDVPTAFDMAKKVMNRIRLNFFWAMCYNLVGMPIAAGVFFPNCACISITHATHADPRLVHSASVLDSHVCAFDSRPRSPHDCTAYVRGGSDGALLRLRRLLVPHAALLQAAAASDGNEEVAAQLANDRLADGMIRFDYSGVIITALFLRSVYVGDRRCDIGTAAPPAELYSARHRMVGGCYTWAGDS